MLISLLYVVLIFYEIYWGIVTVVKILYIKSCNILISVLFLIFNIDWINIDNVPRGTLQ